MRNVHPSADQFGCGELSLTHDLVSVRHDFEGPSEPSADEHQLGELAATIEGAIIPRLLLNHGLAAQAKSLAADFAVVVDAATIDSFVRLLMAVDAAAPGEFVNQLRARGISKDSILLDLFGPAARALGDMWSADLCSFVDVTLGLSRIQALMRSLGGLGTATSGAGTAKGRVLLVPAPGEQQTRGLRVVEEFLLREGWDVSSRMQTEADGIVAAVAAEWFEFIGLSASREALIVGLSEAISGIRKESLNPGIRIMVGGVLFATRPDLATDLGADGCCADPREAVQLASSWARNGSAPKLYLS